MLFIALLYTGRKNAEFSKLTRTSENGSQVRKAYRRLVLWLAGFVLILVGIGVFLIQQKDKTIDEQQWKLAQQKQMIESIRINSPSEIMGSVLDHLIAELRDQPSGPLSAETIAQIVKLSHTFEPYPYWDGDSSSTIAYSPERGKLLRALLVLDLDSSSLQQILGSATFAHADLHDANLFQANLEGIEMPYANLTGANLLGVNLRSANLEGARFWGASMEEAQLDSANLRRADFKWAHMKAVNLSAANLNGADLSKANIIKANLSGISSEWSFWTGALLMESNLEGCNLLGAKMDRANLSKANLNEALLREVDFKEAIFAGIKLERAPVGVNWLDRFGKSMVIDGAFIQENYEVVKGSSAIFKDEIYILRKKNAGGS